MRHFALNSCCALLLSVATFTGALQRSEANEDEPWQILGELAAYSERCGYREDDQWLQSRFGHLERFKTARRGTRVAMEGYDFVRLPCGRVRQLVQEIRSEVADEPVAKYPTDFEICNSALTRQAGTADWESSEAWLDYVAEAKRRKLTPDQCAELLAR